MTVPAMSLAGLGLKDHASIEEGVDLDVVLAAEVDLAAIDAASARVGEQPDDRPLRLAGVLANHDAVPPSIGPVADDDVDPDRKRRSDGETQGDELLIQC